MIVIIVIARLAQLERWCSLNIFLDYHSRVPVYEQIKEQIIRDIGRGILKPNEQLPSLRQLSSQLGLNINTVKRALSELEAQGVTYSVAGKGIFISSGDVTDNAYLQQVIDNVKDAIGGACRLGVAKKKIEEITNQIYEGAETND